MLARFFVSMSQVKREIIRPDYDKYRNLADKHDEAKGRASADRVNLKRLVEKDLFCTEEKVLEM